MRKTAALFIVLFFCSLLNAQELSFSLAAGARRTSAAQGAGISAEARFDGLSLFMQTVEGKDNSLVLSYDLRQGSTLTHSFIVSASFFPHQGGFATASYAFSQHIQYKWLFVNYAAGLQLGTIWSHYSDVHPLSISLMGRLAMGLNAPGFDISLFITSLDKERKSWKSTGLAGAELGLKLNENVRLYTRAFAEFAELAMNPYFVVSAYSISFGAVFKGQI